MQFILLLEVTTSVTELQEVVATRMKVLTRVEENKNTSSSGFVVVESSKCKSTDRMTTASTTATTLALEMNMMMMTRTKTRMKMKMMYVEEEEAEEDFGKEALKTWHERWFEEYAGPVEAKENETGCCICTAEEEVLRQRAENEGEGAEVKDVAVHNKIVAIKDVFVSNEGCSWEHSVVLRVSYTGGGEIWEEVS